MGLKDRDYYWEHIRKLEEKSGPHKKQINAWDWITIACIAIAASLKKGYGISLLKSYSINPDFVIFCSFLIAVLCNPKTSAWDKKEKGHDSTFRTISRWIFKITLIAMLIISAKISPGA